MNAVRLTHSPITSVLLHLRCIRSCGKKQKQSTHVLIPTITTAPRLVLVAAAIQARHFNKLKQCNINAWVAQCFVVLCSSDALTKVRIIIFCQGFLCSVVVPFFLSRSGWFWDHRIEQHQLKGAINWHDMRFWPTWFSGLKCFLIMTKGFGYITDRLSDFRWVLKIGCLPESKRIKILIKNLINFYWWPTFAQNCLHILA